MKRILVVVACGLNLAACSSMPSWMQLNTTPPPPPPTTMQFESEPAGAEARTSFGQSCRTPCSLSAPMSEFTVSLALPGYEPQTVPVHVVTSNETPNPNEPGEASGPRLVPNPVFVELHRLAPPRPVHKKRPVAKKPRLAPPRQAAPAPAPQPAPAPAPAPASPWPPPPAH